MAKIRKDLVGVVYAVNELDHKVMLQAGDEVPDGYFVGGHALKDGDVRDQTPPWKKDAADTTAAQPAQETPAQPKPTHKPSKKAKAPKSDGADKNADATGPQEPVGEDQEQPLIIPPKSGAGSAADAWRAYAVAAAKRAGLNIDIPGDATRADIIDALNGVQIPTE